MQRLTPEQKTLIRESFDMIADNLDAIVADFYHRLFLAAPAARGMFSEDIGGQSDKMLQSLEYLIEALDRPQELQEYTRALGRTHADLGTTKGHFELFIPVFTASVAAACEGSWTSDMEGAWRAFLADVSAQMGFPVAP